VRSFRALFAARFTGSSAGWLAALVAMDRPMPDADGFAWSSVRGDRLFTARLG
jgi:hypothetical protein